MGPKDVGHMPHFLGRGNREDLIGIDPVHKFGEGLSPEVEKSIEKALEMINGEIEKSERRGDIINY